MPAVWTVVRVVCNINLFPLEKDCIENLLLFIDFTFILETCTSKIRFFPPSHLSAEESFPSIPHSFLLVVVAS